jgi:hypothetical protein
MRMRLLGLGLTLAAFALVGIGFVYAGGEKPKATIKEVMKAAHAKGALRDKVLGGTASKEEKEQLLACYKALATNEPPRGTKEDWKKKTDAIVAAAEAVVKGDEGADKTLGKATNCTACHGAHKPPKPAN